MAIRAAVVVCLIVVVMPVFSDGPKSADEPEVYFTRLMYRDVRGRGGAGQWKTAGRWLCGWRYLQRGDRQWRIRSWLRGRCVDDRYVECGL